MDFCCIIILLITDEMGYVSIFQKLQTSALQKTILYVCRVQYQMQEDENELTSKLFCMKLYRDLVPHHSYTDIALYVQILFYHEKFYQPLMSPFQIMLVALHMETLLIYI